MSNTRHKDNGYSEFTPYCPCQTQDIKIIATVSSHPIVHRKDDKGRGEIILGQTLSDAICERSLMVRRYMDKN